MGQMLKKNNWEMNLGIRNACFKIEITDFKFMFLSDAVEK